jgi:hypothetical protein
VLVLREHRSPVGEHVELTSPTRRHLRVDPERLTELGRETRGPFVVPASGGTEEDLDGHAENSSRIPGLGGAGAWPQDALTSRGLSTRAQSMKLGLCLATPGEHDLTKLRVAND